MTMSTEATPVLIVGGGPVGLALSIDLSWRGVPHILAERDARAARADHPRMDQVGIRSMEHFRRLGITGVIEAAGFPRHQSRDVVFSTAVLGHELAREPFDADMTRPPPSFSPQRHELCPQNFLDPALQRVAEASGVAAIRYRTGLTGLSDGPAGVRCELHDDASGRDYVVEAQYLAGCDGSSGAVARLLGISAAEQTLLARSTNIFIEAPGLRARTAQPCAYRHILVGPDGVWASMVNMDGRDVWRLQVLGSAGRASWTEAEACAAVEQALGSPAEYRLQAIVPWVRRELIADRFGAGRCFLLGDAAHQFSPTGGYGMNTGLCEAFDLSWKLAGTLDGWAGPGLLESYEAERRPVAVRNAQRATVNFARMREVPGAPGVLADTAEGAAVRSRLGREIRQSMAEEWESMGIHLGYSYAGSPLVVGDGTEADHSHPAHYVQSAAPGMRAPHAWLPDGRSTLDLFGRGFVLMVFGDAGSATCLLEEATARAMPVRCERIDVPEAARLYGRRFVLVRPDGHVAMRADTLDGDMGAVLDLARGARPVAA